MNGETIKLAWLRAATQRRANDCWLEINTSSLLFSTLLQQRLGFRTAFVWVGPLILWMPARPLNFIFPMWARWADPVVDLQWEVRSTTGYSEDPDSDKPNLPHILFSARSLPVENKTCINCAEVRAVATGSGLWGCPGQWSLGKKGRSSDFRILISRPKVPQYFANVYLHFFAPRRAWEVSTLLWWKQTMVRKYLSLIALLSKPKP